jgi:hypothetical protein
MHRRDISKAAVGVLDASALLPLVTQAVVQASGPVVAAPLEFWLPFVQTM